MKVSHMDMCQHEVRDCKMIAAHTAIRAARPSQYSRELLLVRDDLHPQLNAVMDQIEEDA